MLLVRLLLTLCPFQAPAPLSSVDAVALAAFAQDRGDFARARELYEQALLCGSAKASLLYRAAQCCAGEADASAAASYLFAAAAAGLRTADLGSDPAFALLHAHPRWNELVARVESSAREYERKLRLPELRRELLERMERDQLARESIESLPMKEECDAAEHGTAEPSPEGETEYEVVTLPANGEAPACIGAELEAVDRENTRRLHEIVAQHGWPTRSLVGEDGAQAAWLLVQHADLDPEFQRRCLALMRAAPEGEVALDNLAYLTDRVAMNAGELQTYGTQFRSVDGRMEPAPLLEPDKVDERRRSMGLCSLAIYRAHFQGEHGAPAK